MRKIISVLLVFCMFAAFLPVFSFASADETLGFAVASDLHYNHPREEIDFISEHPVFWHANRRLAMEDESGYIIDEFLKQCAEDESVRCVLISGDLADNGKSRPEDHEAVAEKLKAFEKETGKDVFVINGNHDAGDNCNTTFDDFMRIYADLGYDKALARGNGDCSYTADLGEKYRLICLDSNAPDKSTEDGMNARKMDWVRRQTAAAKKDGRYPVLMMHHNLLDHMPLQRIINRNFIVKFHYSTASLFADMGIKLVFTGHEHCSDAAVFTSAAGNRIYDFATTSLTMYPLQYRVFNLAGNGIDYSVKTVDSIDLDALTASTAGYIPEQLSLMSEGLNAFSKGFAKQGLKYRLALSLTMEKMGISEDDFYFDLVNTAVGGLTDILEMPLYGENSVQELAAEYNIDIPDSGYENGWDLAGELVCAHYAGSETFSVDSPEVKILLRTVALILRDDLAAVNDEVFMRSANALLEKYGMGPFSAELTKLCASVFGGVKPGEYFIIALVSPLLYEFALDSDGVDDNAGHIEGYAQNSVKDKAGNIIENIKGMLEKLIAYLRVFLGFIFREL